MEETKVDKSKVIVPVPKRFWKGTAPEVIVWQEFKLKTRLMPNHYRVTLGLIIIEGIPDVRYRTVLGASACSPDDIGHFSYASAYQRALGRARQKAFDSICQPGVRRDTLLFDPDLSEDVSVEDFHTLTTIKEVLDAVHDGTDVPINSHYDLVARNAERTAVLREASILRREFGCRFDITVGSTSRSETEL